MEASRSPLFECMVTSDWLSVERHETIKLCVNISDDGSV
jgi:hypothetical protein